MHYFFFENKIKILFFPEHNETGSLNWTKLIILFDAALICLLCKEIGIMVLVRNFFQPYGFFSFAQIQSQSVVLIDSL